MNVFVKLCIKALCEFVDTSVRQDSNQKNVCAHSVV
jgi:hypothetical protein